MHAIQIRVTPVAQAIPVKPSRKAKLEGFVNQALYAFKRKGY